MSARSRSRRLLPSAVLLASLIAGVTGVAATERPTTAAPSGDRPAAAATTATSASTSGQPEPEAPSRRPGGDIPTGIARPVVGPDRVGESVRRQIARAKVEVRRQLTASSARGGRPTTTAAATSYSGRNHVWIPSLGMSRDLVWFSCSRSKPPGHQLYQWGCAGRNNVYVFGHAASVMRPLHDAYVSGRLSRGMRVIHADASGRIRTYKVSYWRVVSPVGSSWAYATQSQPSMTLQTCVGARSQYRLIVRLIAS